VDDDNQTVGAGDAQTAYEVQIDTKNTFDSNGEWKPLCSSGKVSGPCPGPRCGKNAYWDVPGGAKGCNLKAGTKYYFRIRTWDDAKRGWHACGGAPCPGLWSDYANAFFVAPGAGANPLNRCVSRPEQRSRAARRNPAA